MSVRTDECPSRIRTVHFAVKALNSIRVLAGAGRQRQLMADTRNDITKIAKEAGRIFAPEEWKLFWYNSKRFVVRLTEMCRRFFKICCPLCRTSMNDWSGLCWSDKFAESPQRQAIYQTLSVDEAAFPACLLHADVTVKTSSGAGQCSACSVIWLRPAELPLCSAFLTDVPRH